MPLILTHGWPGSFLEMLKVLPLLTDPAAHGHDAADSFDVIVPSLPGFGYSERPEELGMNFFRIAEIWVELMSALGYQRFAAQGGDLGAGVSTALGLRHHERVIGVHLNYIPGSYRPYLSSGAIPTASEERFLTSAARWFDENGAYAHLQGTRPNTPAYALNDSPAGLAAWVVEKFRDWSDCDGDVFRSFTRNELLANITLYWATRTISSSFQLYLEVRKAPLCFSASDFVHVPCGIVCFPKEILFPPREWVERGYNVRHWAAMAKGGHFAALEQPEALAADIRAFYRPLSWSKRSRDTWQGSGMPGRRALSRNPYRAVFPNRTVWHSPLRGRRQTVVNRTAQAQNPAESVPRKAADSLPASSQCGIELHQ